MSQWIYVKVATEGRDENQLLSDVMRPWLAEQGDSIKRFFFLRYFEGGQHLRCRFELAEQTDSNAVQAALTETLNAVQPALSLQWCGYQPELLKHGGHYGMAVAHNQFAASAQFALSMLEDTRERLHNRPLVATLAMHQVFDALQLPRAERIAWLSRYSQYWQRVSGVDACQRPQPDEAQIAQCLELIDQPLAVLADLQISTEAQCTAYADRIKGDIAQLNHHADAGTLWASRELVVSNLLHTANNRMGLVPVWECYCADMLLEVYRRLGEDHANHAPVVKVVFNQTHGVTFNPGPVRHLADAGTAKWSNRQPAQPSAGCLPPG